MTAVIAIAEWSILAFGLLLLVAQLAMNELGFRLGQRRAARQDAAPENVGIVVGGVLGLLAFVLALTLSFANARFAERRAGALAEANAIGTAWLRAEAIGTPRGHEIARLLEDYTRVRRDFANVGNDAAAIDALNARTNALQSTIWGHLAAVAQEQPNPISASLMASLNDMFDAGTAERFAFNQRLPPQIFWLLIFMAMTAMGVLGYQIGLRGRPVGLLTVMWTLVIVHILDLASARLGSFRTGTAVYEWTLKGFSGGVSIPPLKPAGP